MNIVQLNKIVKQIANCVELVHSYSDSSPYEFWNTEDVKYGSICFCIKKTRMRSNTTEYTALLYYGDRLLQDGSNKNEVWSNANDVLQNIIGTLNYTSDGSISVAYPYDITHFEQKFADNLAGAYAQVVITVAGIGECGNLLYGYEGAQEDIKLESIVKTITVNGEYDIVPSEDYDAISDVKVIVDVIPVINDENIFARAGYTDENAGHYFDYFNEALDYAAEIKESWDPSVTSLWGRFQGDKKLVYMPMVDTSNVTNIERMFYDCYSLTTIPQLDTSNVTNMTYMFYNCNSLTTIPQLNTSNVTNMSYMFYYCNSLTTIPQLNTSNVTNIERMFYNCDSLTTIPQLDTSNVTNMSYMFTSCYGLTSIPQLDTSNVTNMSYMFTSCSGLTSIPLLDCISITNTGAPFGWSDLKKLTDLGGFKDLKVSWSSNFLDKAPNATVESLMNVINNLYDLTANGLSGKTLKFGTTNLNKLTADQIAVAVNKGWTLT